MLDKFKDECGVFGIFGHPEAANLTYLGLYALQHRGQESAGIAASDGEQVRISRAMGYVADVFDERDARAAARAASRSATSATRPPARASCSNAQPILIDCAHGQIAHLPQRQPRQRAASCATSWSAQGSIFQIEQRHRGRCCTSTRGRSARDRRGRARRVGLAGAGRVLARAADQGSADRRRAIRTASVRSRSAGSATPTSSARKPARWI